jgi:hypothetical protein
MNQTIVVAGLIVGLAGKPQAAPPATTEIGRDMTQWVKPVQLPTACLAEQAGVALIVDMPGVRLDDYPAVRLEHNDARAPGVIMNALNGQIIREGVKLWGGSCSVSLGGEACGRVPESVATVISVEP